MKDLLKDTLEEMTQEMIKEDRIKEENSPDLRKDFAKDLFAINEDQTADRAFEDPEGVEESANKKIRRPWRFKNIIGIAAALALLTLAVPSLLNLIGMGSNSPYSNSNPVLPPHLVTKGEDAVEFESEEASPEGSLDTPIVGSADDVTDSSGSESSGQVSSLPSIPQKSDEKIIYHFDYELQTTNYEETDQSLKQLLNSTNSYIEEANIWQTGDDTIKASYLIRVPRLKSRQFQESIQDLATITRQSVSTENRSQSYKDMTAYLTTLNIKEKRMQALLERAEKMEDIILLENQLADILSQKEYLNKEVDQIEYDVDYQFFSLNITEVKEIDQLIKKDASFSDKLIREFSNSIKILKTSLASLLLIFARYWTLILITVLVLALIVHFIRRKRL